MPTSSKTAKTALKFKKGDLVTDFPRNVECRGEPAVFRVFFCTVASWGKKQGTLKHTASGEMMGCETYADRQDHVFPGHDIEQGRAHCARVHAEEIARREQIISRWTENKWIGWEANVAEWTAELEIFRAGFTMVLG